MADNRTEIAIETIDRIAAMLIADASGDETKHAGALRVLAIYKSAVELTAPPKVGRPRKAKGEAQT